MRKVFKATATRFLVVLLAITMTLGMSGCLPIALYEYATQKQVSSIEQPTRETQGLYKDMTFDELCDVLFAYEVSWDSLTLNQLVVDPQALGIEVPRPATLGDYSFAGTQEDNKFYAEILEALTQGNNISYETLSEQDALTYTMIEKALRQTLEFEGYFYYGSLLNPSTGVQSNLPMSLMDYCFRSVDDIEIYLEALEDTPRLFKQLIEVEHEKVALNTTMPREAMEDTIEEARAYTGSADSHVLTATFEELLDAAVAEASNAQAESAAGNDLASLTAEQLAEYKQRNRDAIEAYIAPSYEYLIAELEPLVSSCKEGTRLYDYARGTEYYELSLKSMGFAQNPSQVVTDLDQALQNYWDIIVSNDASFDWSSMIPEEAVHAIGENPEDYISYIQEKSSADFAPANDLTYEIKIAPEASPNDYAMAYFRLPPVDDPKHNIIVYYPRNIQDDVELFSTIAHEGYPGHMYQTYAYSLENPKNINKVLGSTAYMEGWAMYAQGEAMRYLDTGAAGIEAYIAYEKFLYALHARVDVGVNFEGWSVDDTERYLANWGFDGAGEDLYNAAITQPVSYLAYGLGVYEFDQFRARTQNELGAEFNTAEYHHVITSMGPLSLDMVEAQLEEWTRSRDFQEL